jgi:CRP-like cAMP-binding protein
VAQELPLFGGLDAEQLRRLAGVCTVARFEPDTILFRQGDWSDQLYVVLEGTVEIAVENTRRWVGSVTGGECLGELSLLTRAPHSATATARTAVETAVLDRRDLEELIRMRPDIGIQIYKNLAIGLGEKLKRTDASSLRP